MDKDYLIYLYHLHRRKIWMYVILFLIAVFFVSVIMQVIRQEMTGPTATVTTTELTTLTTISPITTTTVETRIKSTRKQYQMGIYCSMSNDCTGHDHPLCNGFWTCEDNECMWYCWK